MDIFSAPEVDITGRQALFFFFFALAISYFWTRGAAAAMVFRAEEREREAKLESAEKEMRFRIAGDRYALCVIDDVEEIFWYVQI